MPTSTPREVLRLLMQTNGLTQAELGAELGGQPVVSAILNRQARDQRASGECSRHALRHFVGGVHRLNRDPGADFVRRNNDKGGRDFAKSGPPLYSNGLRCYGQPANCGADRCVSTVSSG